MIRLYKILCIGAMFLLPGFAASQNLLPNPSFENAVYRMMTQEVSVAPNYYQFWYPYLAAPAVFHGPYAAGQFSGGYFEMYHGVNSQVVYSNTSGVKDWENPYTWITVDTDDPNCVDYSMEYGVGPNGPDLWTINLDTMPNQFDDHTTNVKFHAADLYKNGYVNGRYFYMFGDPNGVPFNDNTFQFIRLQTHFAHSGASYAGMKSHALIQTEVPGGLNPEALYKFTCAIKPIKEAYIDPYCFVEYHFGGVYSNYYNWDSPAKLKVILAKNKMTYEHADCYSSADNPAFKEKSCGLWGDQILFEYTVADLDPAQLDFTGGDWVTLTAYIRAPIPAYAMDLQWFGIELQGNSSQYIIIDDVSLELMPEPIDCDENITISNSILYDWAGNDRSSFTWIHIGPSVTVPTGADSRMIAAEHIDILPGFVTSSACHFNAYIHSCSPLIEEIEIWGQFEVCDNLYLRQMQTGQTQQNIKVYPNPTSNIITIEKFTDTIACVDVVNIFGETVVAASNFEENSTSIDLSDQAEGVYFVRITQGTKTEIVRVVKMNE